jgi:hypothetical protein
MQGGGESQDTARKLH